jgi:molybdate-binding protein
MGAEAAARRFGLHFRKLGEETYFLVLPARAARDRRVRALVARMRATRGVAAGRGPRANARRRRIGEGEGSAR